MAGKTATKKKTNQRSGDARLKALDTALAKIEKDFGKGAVRRLGDEKRPPRPSCRNLRPRVVR